MNKVLLSVLILLILNNCSTSKKAGFWNKDDKDQQKIENKKTILIKKIRYLIKNFYYVFCKKDYKFVNNKSICVLDSFDMNKPENFFCNKFLHE